jgi:dUTP pyrophosphatase
MEYEIKLHDIKALIPVRGSVESAGYDIYACLQEPIIIKPHNRASIPTEISISIPTGYYGRIASRSGLSFKKGIETGAGIIDSDYLGKISVLLHNHSDIGYIINNNDRIAQIIFSKHEEPCLKIVNEFTKETKRNEDGFGSTGK